jgi:hypothetical protein
MVSEPVAAETFTLPERNILGDYVVQPLLLTMMMTCISISIIALGRSMMPQWWGGYLLIGMVLTTVEAIYSFRVLMLPSSRGISVTRYRLVEIGLLVMALKVVTFIGRPWAAILPEVELFIRQPGALFSFDYILMVILAVIVWGMTYGTMIDFEALHDPITFRTERIPAIDKIATRFYWGGGILVICSGLALLIGELGLAEGLLSLASLNRASIGGVVINALVYFMVGLVMLSQVRLTTMLTRWHIQQVHVDSNLGRQWAKYGLIFLVIVGLLVLFLPTGYSVGIFASARYFFSFLAQVAIIIVQLVVLLITLPLTLLASLFGSEPPSPAASGPISPPPIPPGEARETPPWYELLRSLAFWITFASIAFYLVKTYFADRPELLNSLKRFAPLRWLLNLVSGLVGWLVGVIRAGIERIPKKVDLTPRSRMPGSKGSGRRLPRFGTGTDRERILYYYLTTLQQAERAGLPRQRHQTPYEYEPHLRTSVPDVESEIDFLTEAFVHARYSQDEFDREHADLVKTIWGKIRSALQDREKRAPDKT